MTVLGMITVSYVHLQTMTFLGMILCIVGVCTKHDSFRYDCYCVLAGYINNVITGCFFVWIGNEVLGEGGSYSSISTLWLLTLA